MKVIICGDTVPTGSNKDLFINGTGNELFGEELNTMLINADLVVFNLETPLSDIEEPIRKCGPNLIADPETLNLFTTYKKVLFTLANNHIMDQGKNGLFTTIDSINQKKYSYSGAGENIHCAKQPFIYEYKGKKIGFYCCTEHEFSIASENSAGANPFDPLNSLDDIACLSEQCDYTIVLYHGGKEHYRYPSPYLQRVCQKMVDKGANFVICQHTHCVGCEERYKNSRILYGQGNFVFDRKINDCWDNGLVIEIELSDNCDECIIKYHPIVKCAEKIKLDSDHSPVLSDFIMRSEEIKNNGFIETRYKKFAEDSVSDYYAAFSGKIARFIPFRCLNRLSNYRFMRKLYYLLYGENENILLQNFVECEAHRELLLEGIKRRSK